MNEGPFARAIERGRRLHENALEENAMWGDFPNQQEENPGIEELRIAEESAKNAITFNNIQDGNVLVNFRGNANNSFESKFGRYYKNTTIPNLANIHPITRGPMFNKRRYTARLVRAHERTGGAAGQKRRRRAATRKSRKSHKSHKSHKVYRRRS
jgi:hypothetical protein